MTQPTPLCQSGILNGGDGIKMIRQPSYLLNTTTVDFFCFREVKSELVDLLLSQGGQMMNLEGVVKTILKNMYAFWQKKDRWEHYSTIRDKKVSCDKKVLPWENCYNFFL
jgi:hypothetical protein